MKTRLIIVVVISIIRGCYSTPACSSSLTPVVGACTETQSGQVTDTLYIDTGTGPNYQENRCRCILSVSLTSTKLVFQSLAGGDSFNHTIEVAGYVLNSTTTRIEVVKVSDPTDLWIKTDGYGGICVSVTINPPVNEKRFSITCFLHSINLTTTTSSSSVTSAALHTPTTETTGTYPTSSFKSQTHEPDKDNESLIGPVVGGATGLVVLVSITAIAIYCIRRKHSKLKETGTHSDKSSNAQANKYTDTMENSVSDKAVADNRAISIIDSSYDDVNLDRDSGCHQDKKKQTEKGCHFSVYHMNEKPVQKTEGKLAVYSVVNKHPKLLTKTTQDTNENVYDRTDHSGEKEKGMEEYNRLEDNVYDRTGNSVEKVKGMEEYNRLGSFQVRGIDTDDTYDSATTNTGYNVDRNVQNDYSTSYRKP